MVNVVKPADVIKSVDEVRISDHEGFQVVNVVYGAKPVNGVKMVNVVKPVDGVKWSM